MKYNGAEVGTEKSHVPTVQPGKQLVFTADIEARFGDPVDGIEVIYPDGTRKTIEKHIEAVPGRKQTVAIPYTPKQGETEFTLKLAYGSQVSNPYTVKVRYADENTPAPNPTTRVSTPKPDTPKDSTKKELIDLGTITVDGVVEAGATIDLPIEQLKNTSNTPWSHIYIVSEDEEYVSPLIQKEGDDVTIKAGENFPKEHKLPKYKVERDKRKTKYTVYTDLVNQVLYDNAGSDRVNVLKDFAVPTATFTLDIPNIVTERPNFFGKVAVTSDGVKATEVMNMFPKRPVWPQFLLQDPEQEPVPDLQIVTKGKTHDLSKIDDNGIYKSSQLQVSAPEGKEDVFEYTIRSRNSDVTYNSGKIQVRNVLQDDSKVPELKYPGTLDSKGNVVARTGTSIGIEIDKIPASSKIYMLVDEQGKPYYPNGGSVQYTVKETDFQTPKTLYALDKNDLVVGKFVLKFDEKYNNSMIELVGDNLRSAHFDEQIEQELIVHNYTKNTWDSVNIEYDTLEAKNKRTKAFKVALDTPLKPGESTRVKVNFVPEYEGLDTYKGQFKITDPSRDEKLDVSDEIIFDLSVRTLAEGENPFNFLEGENNTMTVFSIREPRRHTVKSELGRSFTPQIIDPYGNIIEREVTNHVSDSKPVGKVGTFSFKYTPTEEDIERGSATFKFLDKDTGEVVGSSTINYKTAVDYDKVMNVNVNARYPTNRDEPVRVQVDPSRSLAYTVRNTGSFPMVNVEVTDKLVAGDGSGEVLEVELVKPDGFNGTLLPGERKVYTAKLPDGLRPGVEYFTSAEALGNLPKRPARGRDFDGAPDYGEDRSSVLIISPSENLKGNAHIVVQENTVQEYETYKRASRPEDIVVLHDDTENFARTYKNPDGTIVTLSATDGVTIRVSDKPDSAVFTYRPGSKFVRYYEAGSDLYKVVGPADADPFDYEAGPKFIGESVVLASGIKLQNGDTVPMTGPDSLVRLTPYLAHNAIDFYQNVTGASEREARMQASMFFLPASSSSFSLNDEGSLVLSKETVKAKGAGTYDEEVEVFDSITYEVKRIKVNYTIHPDGTAVVNYIEAPEGMDFEVTSNSVDIQDSGSADPTVAVSPGGEGKGDGSVSGAEGAVQRQGRDSVNAVGHQDTDTKDADAVESNEERGRGILAVTGVPAGLVATVLLALMSLLGALVVVRRGRTGKGE